VTVGLGRLTLVVDGFARGTCSIRRERGAATLVVEPFARLPKPDRAAIAAEGERLLAFAAAEADARDVRFADPA